MVFADSVTSVNDCYSVDLILKVEFGSGSVDYVARAVTAPARLVAIRSGIPATVEQRGVPPRSSIGAGSCVQHPAGDRDDNPVADIYVDEFTGRAALAIHAV
jgi:hypothetical protein